MTTTRASSAKVIFVLTCVMLSQNFGTVRCSTDNNIYDVLRLIYRLCASEHDDMQVGVKCLDHYMGGNGGEMADSAKRCMQLREGDSPDPVSEMCSRYTDISEWQAKNKLPPPSLTGVISLSGLTKMMCVMGDLKVPIHTWQTAFSKCFPRHQDWLASRKALWFITRYLLSKS
uniref:Secreted protein n=1 Tax=Ixodes ricinus TaxID=34613 RepID=A0A147BWQ3_IXORI